LRTSQLQVNICDSFSKLFFTGTVLGVVVGIHQLSQVFVKRQRQRMLEQEAAKKEERHQKHLTRYSNYIQNHKEGEKILTFESWKLQQL